MVDGLDVAAGNRLGDHLGGLGLGLGGALAGLGIAESGLAPSLGGENDGLLLAFGLEDRRLAVAFGHQNGGALVPLGLHLAGHRLDKVARRVDVLDLDPGHLDAPGHGRLVDDAQQPVVDLVALGQEVVELIDPMTVRMLVMVRLSTAFSSSFTS